MSVGPIYRRTYVRRTYVFRTYVRRTYVRRTYVLRTYVGVPIPGFGHFILVKYWSVHIRLDHPLEVTISDFDKIWYTECPIWEYEITQV